MTVKEVHLIQLNETLGTLGMKKVVEGVSEFSSVFKIVLDGTN